MTHLTLLESSGIVDYGSLPTAPAAGRAARARSRSTTRCSRRPAASAACPGVNTSVILLVLAAALVAGVVTTMRIFRTR